VIVSAVLLATVAAVALVRAPADSSGAALYRSWCAKCHGADEGGELPVRGPEPRHPRVTAFLLWDYGDGGLFRGW
jgi:mono/diheme cytochrome c family protein